MILEPASTLKLEVSRRLPLIVHKGNPGFLVLDRDVLTIPEEDIPNADVLMTVVGGKAIHLGAALAGEIGMQPAGPSTWTEPIPEGWVLKPY